MSSFDEIWDCRSNIFIFNELKSVSLIYFFIYLISQIIIWIVWDHCTQRWKLLINIFRNNFLLLLNRWLYTIYLSDKSGIQAFKKARGILDLVKFEHCDVVWSLYFTGNVLSSFRFNGLRYWIKCHHFALIYLPK